MRNQPSLPACLGRAVVRAVGMSALLALGSIGVGLANHATPTPDHPTEQQVRVDGFSGRMHAAIRQHHCSTSGFGDGSEPPTALIRTGHGRLRVVPFALGWEVFTGERPGTLVAVCLDQPKAPRAA